MSSAIKRCSCRQVLDVHGDHLLGCGNGNLRIRCHNALGEGIFHTLNNNANCQMEQRCNGYSNSRPGDIYHLDFELGCPTYFDITVRNCFQPHLVVRASNWPDLAAEAGEEAKDNLHQASVTAAGGIFHSIVVETFGLWSFHSLDVLKSVARTSALHNHLTASQPPHTSINSCPSDFSFIILRWRLALKSSEDILG
ncbi:uncharacterized protein LOC134179104 [Corticium candelabrum]|uniref:uncharacterized protein LOC134179104 n=1 Tax=Corticium candelabrum TaxID=121492 RepID=UPI002E259F16|nr:uncharacterized protein LOC134179104 [Corticium candelabrum]